MDVEMKQHWEGFGKFLAELLSQRKLAGGEFASLAGMSPTQISRLLNGESGTRRPTIKHFVSVLGITEREEIEAFYAAAGFPAPGSGKRSTAHKSTSKNAAIFSMYDALTNENQEEVEAVIKFKFERQETKKKTVNTVSDNNSLRDRVQWGMQECKLYTSDGQEASRELTQQFWLSIDTVRGNSDVEEEENEFVLFKEAGM